MKDNQKNVGILFSLPVCIVATFFVFPIGVILIFMRLYKKGKISKKVKNIGVGASGAFIGILIIGIFTLPEVDTPGVAARPSPSNPSASVASVDASTKPQEEKVAPVQPSESLPVQESTPTPIVTKQEAINTLWQALTGAEPFTDSYNGLPFYLAEYMPFAFTVVDLNGDGLVEIIAEMETELLPDRAMLYYKDGTVYGTIDSIEFMNTIFTDGTIEYIDNGNTRYYIMDFNGSGSEAITITPALSAASNSEQVAWYDYSDEMFDAVYAYVTDGHTVLDHASEAAIDPYRSDYLRAQQFAEDGNYEAAIEILKTMPDYKNASRMVSGFECTAYANSISTRVIAQFASMSLVGMEVSCEYSPTDYQFTMLWEIPENGIFGTLSGILSSATGESVTYDEDGMRGIAKDIYEDYFLPEGYEGITCVVEMRDYANDVYQMGAYPDE